MPMNNEYTVTMNGATRYRGNDRRAAMYAYHLACKEAARIPSTLAYAAIELGGRTVAYVDNREPEYVEGRLH